MAPGKSSARGNPARRLLIVTALSLEKPAGHGELEQHFLRPLVEGQIPDTMKARNMTADQVKNDVILAAQPTKQFVTYDQLSGLMLYLASDAGASANGAAWQVDGGWTAQ